jgi:hypothetical protein
MNREAPRRGLNYRRWLSGGKLKSNITAKARQPVIVSAQVVIAHRDETLRITKLVYPELGSRRMFEVYAATNRVGRRNRTRNAIESSQTDLNFAGILQ